MSKKKKFYESSEFRTLQAKWYDKISARGFKDLETPKPKKSRQWENYVNFSSSGHLSMLNQEVTEAREHFTDSLLAILHFAHLCKSNPDLSSFFRGKKGCKVTKQDTDLIKLWIANKSFKEIAEVLNILYLDDDPKMLRTGKGKDHTSYFRRLKSLGRMGSILLSREEDWRD